MHNNFCKSDEIKKMKFREVGLNVLISRDAKFYSTETISIGNDVRIDDFCILSGTIKIGNYVHIGAGTTLIGGRAGIELEDFSGLSHKVSIFAISDDFDGRGIVGPMVPDKYRKTIEAKVLLRKHAVVGCGSVILPGIILAEGTAVGTMSLVLRNTHPWKTYFGIPAKIIGDRDKRVLALEKEFISTK